MATYLDTRLTWKSLWKLIRAAWADFREDNAQQYAAAVAFFTILSLAPLLILAIGLAGIFYGREAARGGIVAELGQYLGSDAAHALQSLIANAGKGDGSVFASILGVIALAWGASRIFQQLRIALNQILDIDEPPATGIIGAIRNRLVAIAGVLVVGLILLSAVIVNAVLSRLKNMIPFDIPGGPFLWQALSLAISLSLVLLTFMIIFRFLPDERIPWRTVRVGAGFTTVLFALGQVLITLYLSISHVGSSFGAGGSLILLILWIYYSSSIFFFGAEMMQAFQHGGLPRSSVQSSTPQLGHKPELPPATTPEPKKGHAKRLAAMGAVAGASGCLGLVGGIVTSIVGAVVLTVRSLFRWVGRRDR